MRVVSIGSVNVDFQVRVERWPGPGETLTGEDFLRIPGGKAFNRAWLARRLGIDAEIVGRVGDDDLAEDPFAALRDARVKTARLRRVPGAQTAVSMIFTRADGDKTIVLATNANDAWTDDDARDAARAVSEAPEGSLLACDLEVPPEVIRAAAGVARERGMPVLIDPSPTDRVDDRILALADYVTPNSGEAARLTDREAVESFEDAERAGRALRGRGARAAIVKLGARGCVVVDENGARAVSGLEAGAVDTTGAGDAFAGALAVALVERRALVDAARFAAAAAACAVTGFGSYTSYPTREEIERLLAQDLP